MIKIWTPEESFVYSWGKIEGIGKLNFKKIKVMEKLDLNSRKVKKELLKQSKTLFTIEGLTEFREQKDFENPSKEKEYGDFPKLIETSRFIDEDGKIDDLFSLIPFENVFGGTMNVDKFGPTCMWVFTYDLLDNKTTSKINYDKITILSYNV